jgi:predicted DNA-binding protein (MmcQ/YjbR family)
MKRELATAIGDLCLAYPETECVVSHGSPDYRVRGRNFATFLVNHHGDGRVALWLAAPPGAQQLYTEMEPEAYFVPPYVGPRGWLGVEVNKLSWPTVGKRIREAYLEVAPRSLAKRLTAEVTVPPPTHMPTAEDIDPFLRPKMKKIKERLEQLCLALPETSRGEAFGSPTWKAGSKTFALLHFWNKRLALQTWVGVDRQTQLTLDARYRVPAYMGHNGWIELTLADPLDWKEIEALVLASYRHFALKRMLKELDER